MLNLKIETTTYKLTSLERATAVQALAAKITGKHKPVRPKTPKRNYPKFGESLSTHAYVRDFYAMNGLGETNHFAPLSTHLSVPVGVDSIEAIGLVLAVILSEYL